MTATVTGDVCRKCQKETDHVDAKSGLCDFCVNPNYPFTQKELDAAERVEEQEFLDAEWHGEAAPARRRGGRRPRSRARRRRADAGPLCGLR